MMIREWKLKTKHSVISAAFIIFWVWSTVPAHCRLRITIAYDNAPYVDGVIEDNGFSCLIETGRKKILFDTGRNSTILFSNFKKLDIDLKSIDFIVISHLHNDHNGGLFPILQENPGAKVFLPELSPVIQQMFIPMRTQYMVVGKPIRIGKNFFLTGLVSSMGFQTSPDALGNWNSKVREQALIINTPHGLIIIAGCSHPGITNVIRQAKALLLRPIYLVIGGFHTLPETASGMADVVGEFRALGVKNIGPAHCTKEKAKIYLRAAYGKHYIQMGVGKTLNLSTRKPMKIKGN